MAMFSERIGITPTRVAVQRGDMDAALRNSLWNVVYTMLETPLNARFDDAHRECREVFETVWGAFLKQPVHEIHNFRSERLIATLREPFLIVWPWWKVYDFLEFLPTAFRGARHYTPARGVQLREYLNGVLEREMSAYRFVGAQLVPITDAVEIEAVEHAVNASRSEEWTDHLRTALALLTDRGGSDYARSMREAVLAVDALCRFISNDDHATVEDVLDLLELRSSMGQAFAALFGATTDAVGWAGNGVDRGPDFADAKFMLVAASSFVNFALQQVRDGRSEDASPARARRSPNPIR
jgi:hypothetical protein